MLYISVARIKNEPSPPTINFNFFCVNLIVTHKLQYAPVCTELSPSVLILLMVTMSYLTFCVYPSLIAQSKNEPSAHFSQQALLSHFVSRNLAILMTSQLY